MLNDYWQIDERWPQTCRHFWEEVNRYKIGISTSTADIDIPKCVPWTVVEKCTLCNGYRNKMEQNNL